MKSFKTSIYHMFNNLIVIKLPYEVSTWKLGGLKILPMAGYFASNDAGYIATSRSKMDIISRERDEILYWWLTIPVILDSYMHITNIPIIQTFV